MIIIQISINININVFVNDNKVEYKLFEGKKKNKYKKVYTNIYFEYTGYMSYILKVHSCKHAFCLF